MEALGDMNISQAGCKAIRESTYHVDIASRWPAFSDLIGL